MDQKHCFFLCKFPELRFADWETKDICGFVDLRMQINTYKFEFADLRFPDWHTSEICRFAILERAQEFADLRFAD
jgi:hypothetical protein